MEVSKINRIKNAFLESGELNLVLRETMIDCDRYRWQQGRFRIVLSGFQSFFAKSCKINQILFSR